MAERPFLIGLTGSIGMGKSTAAKIFAAQGLPVFDADTAVHALYEHNGAAFDEISSAFVGSVRNGRIDRTLLAQALCDDTAFARLEGIVHPRIAQMMESFIAAAGDTPLAVLNIPLLYETGADLNMDAVIVVSAPAAIQRARVLARPGMTEEKFSRLLVRQVPDAEKRRRADFVIDTTGSLDETTVKIARITQILLARAKARGNGQ